MALLYFENFEPESNDVLLMCERHASALWCAILRSNAAAYAHVVGLGFGTNRNDHYRSLLCETRIALDAELVLASRIRLHLGDDWKAPEGPSKYIMTGASKNVTPGILQLNGPAAILLHQIRSLVE